MRFNFVVEVSYNGLDAKVPYMRELKGDNPGRSFNIIGIESKSNRAFIEMTGFKNDVISTIDNNNEKIEIAWEDRQKENVLKNVANYKKHVITLNDGRYEYISDFDYVNFVIDHIDELKGKRYQITGQTKPNEYKGKISDKFVVNNMYEVTDDSKKNELKLTGDFYFNKESIDAADFAKERKIYINGWELCYLNKKHPSVYISKQLVFDCGKLNLEDEKHVAILNYKLKQLGCGFENGKVVIPKLKKGKYYKIAVVCKYLNGQETIEFTEKDLTENQKMAIELGIASLEDFKPKGAIYGDRVQIYKLVNFDLRDEYKDGCIEVTDFDESMIYVPTQNEDVDTAFESDAMNPPEEDTDSAEALFD